MLINHVYEVSNVGDLVSRASRLYAKKIALIDATRTYTYALLEQRVNRLANALTGLGLKRGDRVGVYLPNCIELVELELACYKAGLIKAPINARLAPMEVAGVIANSEAALVVTTQGRAEAFLPYVNEQTPQLLYVGTSNSATNYEKKLEQADDQFEAVRVTNEDVAVLHYTSGSSGVLKAAMQTFGNRLAQARKFLMRKDSLAEGDLLGLVGPITHASGMQLVPALLAGATIRIFDGFKPKNFIDDLRKERITHTFLVPTMITLLLDEVEGQYKPLPDLKRLSYGAAPMAPARIMKAMDVFGPILSQGYGAGETTSGVCSLTIEDHLYARAVNPQRLASCGQPYLESLVDIVDEHGNSVAAGEVGEIVVGGLDVFAGYWRAPELTKEVLINGRYHTGDLAFADDEGYIYIVDRKKDMIISGGFNVYPSEVEAILYQHPAIKEVCVFAVPDEKWGESVAAHVVLKTGVNLAIEQLDNFCQEKLAGFKRPRHLKFVENLIKNTNGKIVRREIQAPYWAAHSRKVG